MECLKTFEQAEELREEIVKELQQAEAQAKTVDALFEKLVALLRQVGELSNELKISNQRSATESTELAVRLQQTRDRLVAILKQFPSEYLPPGSSKATGDASSIVRILEVGSWNSQQRLATIGKELDEVKKTLDGANKEAEAERERGDGIKKLVKDAESLLKQILGPTTAESLSEMVTELRRLIEKQRCGCAEAREKLKTCLKVQKELRNESEDVKKVQRQLFDKCAEIERAVAQLCIEGVGKLPAYREDGDEREQFDEALKWLLDTIELLVNELQNGKSRLGEIEQEQKKLDAAAFESSDALKRAMATVNDLNNKIQNAETLLKAGSSASESAEERQKLYDAQIKQLKEICNNEKARSEKVTEILKPVADDMNESLAQLKKECEQAIVKNAELVEVIEKLLAELKNLQHRRGTYTEAEQERAKELEREEEELKARLKEACDKLKAAEERRRAAVDELRSLKKQLDNLAESGHVMEEQMSADKDGHLKRQTEIVRLQMEIAQLQEKANAGERTLQTREQMLKELQDRHARTEVTIRRLERENERLRFEIESGDEADACTTCEMGVGSKPEADSLRNKIKTLQAEIAYLRQKIDDDEVELAELAMEPSTSSVGESESRKAEQEKQFEKRVEEPPRPEPELAPRSTKPKPRGSPIGKPYKRPESPRTVVTEAVREESADESLREETDESGGQTVESDVTPRKGADESGSGVVQSSGSQVRGKRSVAKSQFKRQKKSKSRTRGGQYSRQESTEAVYKQSGVVETASGQAEEVTEESDEGKGNVTVEVKVRVDVDGEDEEEGGSSA